MSGIGIRGSLLQRELNLLRLFSLLLLACNVKSKDQNSNSSFLLLANQPGPSYQLLCALVTSLTKMTFSNNTLPRVED